MRNRISPASRSVSSCDSWLNETRAPLTTARSVASAPSSATNAIGTGSEPTMRAPTAIPAPLPELYVGASGWSYPSWKPGFYPADAKPADFLRFYAARFRTVELNTTGYRLPAEEQFERWAAQTPAGFEFAPKLNAYRVSDFATFEERVGRLGDRLGPIRAVVGSKRDEGLLALMLGSLDPALRVAFDFRHASWDGVETE